MNGIHKAVNRHFCHSGYHMNRAHLFDEAHCNQGCVIVEKHRHLRFCVAGGLSQIFQLFTSFHSAQSRSSRLYTQHLKLRFVRIRQLPSGTNQPVTIFLTRDANQNGCAFRRCLFPFFQ